MNFSRPFIERPIGTTLLALGLLLVGHRRLSLPAGGEPADGRVRHHQRVTASRPGADPETMAATVAAPLERRLGEIAGVTEMTSVNSLGSTRISIQFDLNRSLDGAARDVQAALNAAATDLPSRPADRCRGSSKSNPAAAPVLILALTSKHDLALRHLRRRRYRHRPAHLPGRRRGGSDGRRRRAAGHPRARQSHAARLHGLSIEDVRVAITSANALAPARHHRRRAPGRSPSRATPSCARSRTTSNIVVKIGERQRRAPVRRGDRRAEQRATRARRPCSTPSRRSCSSSPSRATPTSSRRSTASAS